MGRNNYKFSVSGVADLDINKLQSSVDSVKKSIDKLQLPPHLKDSFNNLFSDINKGIDDFSDKSTKTFGSMSEIKTMEKSYSKVVSLIGTLENKISKIDMSKVSLKDLGNIDSIKNLQSQLNTFKTEITNAEKTFNTLKRSMSEGVSAKVDTNELLAAAESSTRLSKVFAEMRKENNIHFKVDASEIEASEKKVSELKNKIQDLDVKQGARRVKGGGGTGTEEYIKTKYELEELRKELQLAEQAQDQLNTKTKEYAINSSAIDQMEQKFSELVKLSKEFNIDGQKANLQEVANTINNIETQNLEKTAQQLDNIGDSMSKVITEGKQLGEVVRDKIGIGNELSQAQKEMATLQNQFSNFFSLTNGWNLMRKVVANATDTVKELDAAMTEIAVVTDMSLDEIWGKRGEYSAQATEMGAKTIDMIDASKLYYQQGLAQAEVTEIATETIKMARIANLDGATATDLMTAAIRGFNMEMTEAAHVNDVYSWLAAKSAADTHEIADAMTRTASIAHSAGATFDNTASFLTQMIETTRESPENLGTALKTIIARFQEMKEAPEGLGEVDGEIVNVNKIEGALRSINVALRNTKGEFRDFDDVIMDISEKWDGLTAMQQRYVATTAAGSRQQSRFIALVQNHGRLLELTGGAANSAGAANEQFEKTTESLESKLNKLHNAMDIFWTNLANSDAIKIAIDLFTGLLETINNLLAPMDGLTKTLVTLFGSMMALKGGQKLIKRLFNALTGQSIGIKEGEVIGSNFIQGILSKINDSNGARQIQNSIMSMLTKGQNLKLEKEEKPKKDSSPADGFSKSKLSDNIAGIQSIMSGAAANTLEYDAALKVLGQTSMEGTTLTKELLSALSKNELKMLTSADASKQMAVSNELANTAMMRVSVAGLGLGKSLATAAASTAKFIGFKVLEIATLGKVSAAHGAAAAMAGASAKAALGAAAAAAAALAPLAIGVGVVAALGAGIYFLVKASTSAQDRFDSLQKSAVKLNEGLDKSNNAIEDLKQSQTELGEMSGTLDSLTKGTQEWREALVGVNNKVIELITTYPNLAAHVTKGLNGELTIDKDGFTQVIKQQEELSQNLRSGLLGNQLQQSEVKKELSGKAFNDKYMTGGDAKIEDAKLSEMAGKFLDAGYTVEDLKSSASGAADALHKLWSEAQGVDPEKGLSKDSATFGRFLDEIVKSENNDFSKLGSDNKQINLETEGYKTSLIEIAKANEELASTFENTEDRIGPAVEGAIGRMAEGASSAIDTRVKDMDFKGAEKDQKIDQYAKMMNKDSSDVRQELKDKVISDSDIKNMIASNDYTKSIVDQVKGMDVAYKDFAKNHSMMAEAIKGLATEDQKGIRTSDLDYLKKSLKVTDDVNKVKDKTPDGILKSLGLENLDQLKGLGFENIDAFIDALVRGEEILSSSLKDLEMMAPEMMKKGVFKELTKNMSAEELSGVGEIIKTTLSKSGKEGAEQIATSLNDIMKGMDSPQKAKFLEALNSLDLSSPGDIKGLEEDLKALGINVDKVSLAKLISEISTLASTAKEMSTTDLKELSVQNKQMAQNIRDQADSGTNAFSQEDVDYLVETGIAKMSDFVFNGDEYVYLGGTMESLAGAVDANTAALIEQNIARLEDKAEAGMYAEDALKSEKGQMVQEQVMGGGEIDYGAALDILSSILTSAGASDAAGELGYNKEQLMFAQNQMDENGQLDPATMEMIAGFMQSIIDLAMNQQQNQNDATEMGNALNASQMMQQPQGQVLAGAQGKLQQDESGKLTMEDVETMRQYTDALIAQGSAYSALQPQVQTVRDAQKALNEALDGGTNKQKEAAKAAADRAKEELSAAIKIQESIKKNEQYAQSTYDATQALNKASKGTDDYKASLSQATQTMNKLIGMDLSEEFLATGQNAKLLEQALSGSESAMHAFMAAANAAMVETDSFADSFANMGNDVSGIVSALDGLEFGVDGTANVAPLIQAFLDAGGTADEVAQFMEKLGMTTVDFDVNTQIMDIAGKSTVIPSQVKARATYVPRFTGGGGRGGAPGGGKKGGGGGGGKKPKGGGGKGGGGGGGTKEDDWENSYDWLYNLTQKINEELRKRNRLEWDYNRILKSTGNNADQLLKNMEAQKASLLSRQKMNDEMLAQRIKEQANVEAEYKGYQQYAIYNEKTNVIEINWDKINAVKSQETGDKISEYIGKLEKIQGEIHTAQDNQMEIVDAIKALQDLGKNEFMDLEQRVFDALLKKYQEVINTQSEINESINNGNDRMLNGLQKGIADLRSDRAKEKAKEDIEEKERRLALLQTDSSGANLLEIKKLEEELENDRENYTDSLIDDAITELQNSHQDARDAAERQIQLMQKNLDFQVKNGDLWFEVYDYMTDVFGKGGNVTGTQMEALLRTHEDYKSKSIKQRDDYRKELRETTRAATAWQKDRFKMSNHGSFIKENAGKSFTFTDKSGAERTGILQGDGTVKVGDNIYGDLYRMPDQSWATDVDPKKATPPKPAAPGGSAPATGATFKKVTDAEIRAKGMSPASLVDALKVASGNTGKSNKQLYASIGTLAQIASKNGISGYKGTGAQNVQMLKLLKEGKLKKYAKGGLVDSTGLAWLDGTKSRPEIVLDAQDSKNFIELKELLNNNMGKLTGKSNLSGGGDNYFNITVEVEEIADDYDVDDLLERVKEKIAEDAAYRNVNVINLS